MRYLRPLLATISLALILSACDSGEDPGTRPSTGGTGGLASTGGAGGGSTGGSSATGGASTGGAVGTGGIVGTGGAVVATGGSSTGGTGTGGAGTGGSAAVPMCGIPDYDGHTPQAGVSWCGKTKANDWIRVRYTADGFECVTCVDSAKMPILGCSLRVPSLKDEKVNNNAKCVDSCAACPVERCFSTGSDYGTEYPCN